MSATGFRPVALRLLFFSLLTFSSTFASTPNVIVSVDGVDKTWYAKRGEFGSEADVVTGKIVHSPDSDLLLCEYFNEDRNETISPSVPPEDTIMLVPRGICTFERKAFAAKNVYGAAAILVYDSLSARYRWNETAERVIFPTSQQDYECGNGHGLVYDLDLDPPEYNGTFLDPILDMTSPTFNCTLEQTRSPCESQLCLVTSHVENATNYPVCCAWDLPMTMQPDATAGDTSDVVAVFLTIRQTAEFLEYIGSVATIEARPRPAFNASLIFLWIMATAITALASWYPAQEYRIFRAKLAKFQADRDKQNEDKEQASVEVPDEFDVALDDLQDGDEEKDASADEDFLDEDGDSEDEEANEKDRKKKKVWALHSLPPPRREKGKNRENASKTWVLYSLPPPEKNKKREKSRPDNASNTANTTSQDETHLEESQESLQADTPLPEAWTAPSSHELTQWHVMGFVLTASIMLFLLFYFQFYNIVTVLYGFGCAGAVSHLIFGPILVWVIPKFGDDWTRELNKRIMCSLNGFDVTSQMLGFAWAILWLWYGLSHYRPSQNAFFWITLNIFGTCFCILALSMLKLTNIRIATMLMLTVFFYDIFFVFITPLFLNGESVMITVAQGGGKSSTADDFCFKYPEDKACKGIDFLPMLLLVPRINDYTGGSSLLGLGDIVLPGFLIAFAARVDEAARLVGKHTKIDIYVPEKWYQGYFFPLVIAYAFGLFMAFLAFSLMEQGQPALLYLVPSCLGTMCFVGRKEWKDLWNGARALRLADKLRNKCQRAWGKERMRRQVEKKKRERASAEQQESERADRNSKRQSFNRVDATGSAANQKRNQEGSLMPPSSRPGQRGPGRRPNPGRRQQQRGPPGSQQRVSGDPSLANQPGMSRKQSHGGRPPNQPGRGPNGQRHPGRGPNGQRHPGRGPNGQRHPGRVPNSAGRSAGQAGKGSKQIPSEVDRQSPPSRPEQRASPLTHKTRGLSPKLDSPTLKTATEPPPPQVSSTSTNDKSDEMAEGPNANDICIGNEIHNGTKEFRRAVRKALESFADDEYGPTVYKAIKKDLKGRRFFIREKNGPTITWKEASKTEIRTEVGKAFDEMKKPK